MSKLEQAARALLVHWDTPAWKYLKPTGDLMAALREALDHSGDANKMVAEPAKRPQNCGTGYCSCIECPYEPVKHEVNQEPVAWAYIDADGSFMDALDRQYGTYQTPLYAAPPKREWQGLTDADFAGLTIQQIFAAKFAEAKLKEKNG